MIQIVLFALIVLTTAYFSWKGYGRIVRNIQLGKKQELKGPRLQRWRNMALVAFGQKKMFKNWIPAVLHLFIYVAFVITQVELIEIILDGLTGNHRMLAPYISEIYPFIISFIEVLSVLAFIATIAFILRRNVLNVKRFQNPEMKGWPFRDANLILIGEIILLIGIFSMNGADQVLQQAGNPHYHETGTFAVTSWLGPALFGGLSEGSLVAVERFGWWLHIVTVFGFLCYLPYSKHLHILLAFPNTWYGRLEPKGEMPNMPEIQKEVRIMMGLDQPEGEMSGELPEFGAKDVFSLTRKNLLDAYTCTECGRCTSACPANTTGKKLSPRKIMMDVRDRADEVGRLIDSGKQKPDSFDDGKSLFDYISNEELHACTTCNACVEACPVLINPLEIILQMRRYEILTLSAGPTEWMPLFNAIENAGAAWQMSEERDAWTQTD